MKKQWITLLALVLCALLVLGACAPQSAPEEETEQPQTTEPAPTAAPQEEAPSSRLTFIPGTYTAETNGYGGPIVAEVTVDETSILSVTVTGDKETQGVGSNAVEKLPGIIVEKQSTGVDVVAGCTISSNAILEAVRAALADSGVDMDALNTLPEEDAIQTRTEELNTQILIIGAGGSGLTAAISATENGAEVLVLEKMDYPGGAASVSTAAINGGMSARQQIDGDKDDSVELIYEDIMRGGHYLNRENLVRLFAESTGKTFDWLQNDVGVAFSNPPQYYIEHSKLRLYFADGNGAGLTEKLIEAFDKTGATLMTQTRATELIVENGAVVGAKAENQAEGIEYIIHADSVILATGGYGANQDMLTDYLKMVPYYGHASSTGDGHNMAEAIGAKLINMEMGKVYPGGFEYEPHKAKIVLLQMQKTVRNTGAIIVAKDGKRKIQEGGYNEEFVEAINAEDNKTLYLVMDQTAFDYWKAEIIAAKKLQESEIDAYLAQNSTAPLLASADTIEELANLAGIDAAALAETIDRFNGFVKNGVDEDFGRTTLPMEFGEGPYYIVEEKLRFATTLGGVYVDDNLAVCDENEQPIANLYAAGEIVGGVHGDDTLTGSAISWAVTSGRLAGEIVAGK